MTAIQTVRVEPSRDTVIKLQRLSTSLEANGVGRAAR